jgi:hypothetical protein
MLAAAGGNQLGAKLTLRYATGVATASIALVQFS